MKKIGIISMQRVPNYGSFLQAYGLKKVIESLGHEVVFIDYKAGVPLSDYKIKDFLVYRLKNISIVSFLYDSVMIGVFQKRKFSYLYRHEYLKMLGVGYSHKSDLFVDCAVIGSDEVFNCTQRQFNVGYSPMLFGNGVSAKRVISYAASFGYTTEESIEKYGVSKDISNYLREFYSISVRDTNSFLIVSDLIKKNPVYNLDPVLIYDFSVPVITPMNKKYAILYTYSSRKYLEEDIRSIKSFCKQHQLQLVSLGDGPIWVDKIIEANPFEVLAYVKEADFIITDTFHGTVLAIKYNKNFATRVRDDNENKLEDLLIRLRQKDREIKDFAELENCFERLPDFSETNKIIDNEKEKSIEYLKQAFEL